MRWISVALAAGLLASPLTAREVISSIAVRGSAGASVLRLDLQLTGPQLIAADASGTYFLGLGGDSGLTAAFSDDLYAGQILPRDWLGWGVLDLAGGRPTSIVVGSYGWSLGSDHYALEWLQWNLDLQPSGMIGQTVWGWIPDYNIAVDYSAVWRLDMITVSTSNVPEPGVWGTLLLGFGVIGIARRRQETMQNKRRRV